MDLDFDDELSSLMMHWRDYHANDFDSNDPIILYRGVDKPLRGFDEVPLSSQFTQPLAVSRPVR